jgi:hypothetical protein
MDKHKYRSKWFTGAVHHFQTLIDPVGRGILMSVLNNRSEAAKKRSLGGKRCVRFSISINNEYDRKLSRLSTSCGMTKSEMSDQLLRIAFDSPNVLDWFQDQFNKVEEYKVRPTVINNKVYY